MKKEYGVGNTRLTPNAAVVEAAPLDEAEVALATKPGEGGRRGRRRRLTPNAVVVEAAPLGRKSDVALATKAPAEAVKDEIRSRRAKLTLNAVVVEAASPRNGEVALATEPKRAEKRVDEAS
ncbi:hypothetical protein NR798_46015 [Archangium gephyra]|uniref:hypothetical protein n=1 Tax=Archangium gephyra TaxID=48 RepID=UPI0035D4FE21